jgi:hypothetical protein
MRMIFVAVTQSIYSYGIRSWGSANNKRIYLNLLENTINNFIKK